MAHVDQMITDWLGRADAPPVAVWVTDPDLRSPGHLLDGRAELLRDLFQFTQPEVDEGVRAGVAGVLGQGS